MADFETTVIEALDALEAGESPGSILARYPEMAAELRPILLAARDLGSTRLAPSAASKEASRREFLGQAAAMRERPTVAPGRWWRWLARALVPAALTLLILGGGALLLAGRSLPGQALYGVKLEIEEFRLEQQRDPEVLQQLLEEYEAERLAEVQRLLARGLVARVAYGDDIVSLAPDRWQMASGIDVRLDEATVVIGEPMPGMYVHIEGETREGYVLATHLRIDPDHHDGAEPVPAPTEPPPTPTATRRPYPTYTPQAPAAPLSGPTLMSTAPPSATPTATPSPSATPTADLGEGGDSATEGAATPAATTTPDDDGADDAQDEADDENGPGSEDDDDNSGSNTDDDEEDSSGPGSGEEDDDNSGSGSDDDDSSGPGSGEEDDDNSGPGSNGDDEDNSGSGSG